MKEIKSIGFIGFGLIGGSIARLLRTKDSSLDLFAYDYHKNAPAPGLVLARSEGVLSRITGELSSFSEADLVFLCAPVSKNIEYLSALKGIIREDCILTDVGSVKGDIAQAADNLGLSRQFIGGHPMAGSEQTGYANSSTMLLENAYYILTPTKYTPDKVTEYMVRLVEDFHAIPVVLDAGKHDALTAAVSHLPHIIAAQLVNLVRTSDDEKEQMRMLAAGGFKDITRIASSSPAMWQAICMSNPVSIKEILDRYIASLKEVSDAIARRDADYFYRIFEEAGTYRASIPNAKGMLNRFFEIFIDISDEAGAIATIATLLGANGISIKNIGIIHNREFEQGVLRIEFYEEDALLKGKRLLSAHNYTLYERG
ncbi:MAG: prephenate dehydrogenase [Lachnospiraceae bacterium]|jgi:prephenate dehydrogenase|nr:prephenate dehydrogenase [Lachnospiraceae bacterium]